MRYIQIRSSQINVPKQVVKFAKKLTNAYLQLPDSGKSVKEIGAAALYVASIIIGNDIKQMWNELKVDHSVIENRYCLPRKDVTTLTGVSSRKIRKYANLMYEAGVQDVFHLPWGVLKKK